MKITLFVMIFIILIVLRFLPDWSELWIVTDQCSLKILYCFESCILPDNLRKWMISACCWPCKLVIGPFANSPYTLPNWIRKNTYPNKILHFITPKLFKSSVDKDFLSKICVNTALACCGSALLSALFNAFIN